tara:strand:- start:494 stop:841 length:348 start_codon:yes stop_codon:yes gene_type:complete
MTCATGFVLVFCDSFLWYVEWQEWSYCPFCSELSDEYFVPERLDHVARAFIAFFAHFFVVQCSVMDDLFGDRASCIGPHPFGEKSRSPIVLCSVYAGSLVAFVALFGNFVDLSGL